MSADRAASILARFNAAHTVLVNRLRDMPPAAAEHRPDPESWGAAQIGCHVALTNEWIAAVLTGATPMAQPAPAGFTERFDPSAVPAKIKTFPSLEPPHPVSRDAALERLRASGQHMSKAIASLTPERGRGYTVTLPFGTLSLYELADFGAAHVTRHCGQLERAVAKIA
jgi:DinB superfamily